MSMPLTDAPRTSRCGLVGREHLGKTVVIKGWAHYRRDHGGLIFIDLRDREGLVQTVFDPETLPADLFDSAHKLKSEDVLAIEGIVRERPEGTANANLKSGEVEILVGRFEVLSRSQPLPFRLDAFSHVSEDLRLRYRYLDLRRAEMQANIIARAKLARTMRRYLDSQGLLEIETPILTRSTPEGARDYLVPSRVNLGSFYALPQSPQLFKQILMIAGLDGYYQIARCFRDEDLRANRQPEFTQLDIEMAFVNREDIYAMVEGLVAEIFREMKGIELPRPFRRMSWAEAMLKYGSDKPDLRFGLEIQDVTATFAQGCNFKVFTASIEKGGVARALRVPGGGEKYSNTQLKPGGELPEYAARYGAKGLAWFRAEAGEGGSGLVLNSNITKFFEPSCLEALAREVQAQVGDLILIVVDEVGTAATAMGQLRLLIGRAMGLIDDNQLALLWVTDFPLFEWDKEEKRWNSVNHPFTAPNPEDIALLDTDPGKVRAWAYDVILNGEEIGGGSIRIHRSDLQEKVFGLLGINAEDARRRFGFLLEALSFGAPPHGGIAFGYDRIMMLLQGTDSIRDVIPFPKTQKAICMMTEAPSVVDAKQLRDLGIQLDPKVAKQLAEAQKPAEANV